jgi:hypothetical protein
MAEYVVSISAPCGWINANDRYPWQQQRELARTWRAAAGWLAKKAKVPPMDRAEVEVWLVFEDGRRRDPHNYYPTAKAAIDGLVDVGVLPDDDAKHLTVTRIDLGPPDPDMPRGLLRLVIRPVVQEPEVS